MDMNALRAFVPLAKRQRPSQLFHRGSFAFGGEHQRKRETCAIRFLVLLFAALLSGAALAQPRICISDDVLTFGERPVSTSTTMTSIVTSCGDTPFTFTGVNVHPATAPAFFVNSTCATGMMLSPGVSCSVGVTFSPQQAGEVSGGLWLHSSTSTPDQIVTFYGRGVDARAGTASLVFAPAPLGFAPTPVDDTAGPVELILRNTGAATLVPSALVLNGPAPYDYGGQPYGDGRDCGVGIGIDPGASCHLKLYFKPQQAGARDAHLVVDAPQLATLAILQITGVGTSPDIHNAIDVVEFHHAPSGQYFITADQAEAAFLDAGGLGPDWIRTGETFRAWPRDASTADTTVDVCRFFGVPGIGPNSHFLTGNEVECSGLKNDPRWIYEGIAFRTALPTEGQCPPGYSSVVRLWLPGANPTLTRHRYVIDSATIATMAATGWTVEGPVFCAP